MGQEEVEEVCMEDNWLTKSQIAIQLPDFSIASINESLKRLCKQGVIKRKPCPSLKHGFLYKIKTDEDDEDE